MFDLRHRSNDRLPTSYNNYRDDDDKLKRLTSGLQPVLANKLVAFIVAMSVIATALLIISMTYTTESVVDRATKTSAALKGASLEHPFSVKEVYLMGGFAKLGNTRELTSQIEKLDAIFGSVKIVSDMHQARYHHTAVADGHNIYVMGGSQFEADYNKGATNRNDRYNPATEDWTFMTPMPTRRTGHTAVMHESTVYVVGGQTSEDKDTTFDSYDVQSNVWTQLPPIQVRRIFPSSASIRNSVYVTGGHQGFPNSALNSVESYDIVNGFWRFVTPMHSKRFGHACVSVQNALYVIGGRDEYDSTLNTVERYDPENNKWSYVGYLNQKRAFAAAAVVVNRYIVLVGGHDGDNLLDSIERFDVYTGKWKVIGSITTPTMGLSATAF